MLNLVHCYVALPILPVPIRLAVNMSGSKPSLLSPTRILELDEALDPVKLSKGFFTVGSNIRSTHGNSITDTAGS